MAVHSIALLPKHLRMVNSGISDQTWHCTFHRTDPRPVWRISEVHVGFTTNSEPDQPVRIVVVVTLKPMRLRHTRIANMFSYYFDPEAQTLTPNHAGKSKRWAVQQLRAAWGFERLLSTIDEAGKLWAATMEN